MSGSPITEQFTVYARLEPTTDTVFVEHSARAQRFGNRMEKRALDFSNSTNMDVQIYADKEATTKMGRFPYDYTQSKPKYNSKYVTVNCMRYNLVWLPPLLVGK